MSIGWINYGIHKEEKYQRNVDWKLKNNEKTKREGPDRKQQRRGETERNREEPWKRSRPDFDPQHYKQHARQRITCLCLACLMAFLNSVCK